MDETVEGHEKIESMMGMNLNLELGACVMMNRYGMKGSEGEIWRKYKEEQENQKSPEPKKPKAEFKR